MAVVRVQFSDNPVRRRRHILRLSKSKNCQTLSRVSHTLLLVCCFVVVALENFSKPSNGKKYLIIHISIWFLYSSHYVLYESTFRLLLINFQSFAIRTVFLFCALLLHFLSFYSFLLWVQAVLEITSCMVTLQTFSEHRPVANDFSLRLNFSFVTSTRDLYARAKISQ